MADITKIREKYPQYNDLSDKDLGNKFYTKFYSDMPKAEFDKKFFGDAPQVIQPPKEKVLSAKQTFQGELRPLFMQPGIPEKPPPLDWKGFGPAVGATIGTKLGMPFGLPGMVGGAAVGAAGGKGFELVSDYFKGEGPETSTEAMQEINKAAAFGGGGEMAGPAVGQIAKPLSRAPGKIWELAKKYKLSLPPSAFTDSKGAKAFEWMGRALPTGRGYMEHSKNVLLRDLEEMMGNVVSKIPVSVDKGAGRVLYESVDAAKSIYKKTAKAQYELWKGFLGDKRPVMEATHEVILKNAEQIKSPTIRAFMEEYGRKGANWSVDDIYNYQSNIWKKTFKKMPQLGKQLDKALKSDLGEELYGELQKGKADWAKFRKLAENKTIKAMARKYANDPDNILYAAFQAGNFDDVAMIKSSVNRETWEVAKSGFVKRITDASMDPNDPTRFVPGRYMKLFDKFGTQIKNVMPEIYGNMKDLYLMTKRSVPFIKQMEPLGQMGKAIHLGAAAAAAGGSAFVSPWIAVPYGFSAAVAHSVTRPAGYLKKYLVTGFPNLAKGASETMRVGGRAAMMKKEKE